MSNNKYAYFDDKGSDPWPSENLYCYILSNCKILPTHITCVDHLLSFFLDFSKKEIKCEQDYLRIYNVFLTLDRIDGAEIYDFSLTMWFKTFSMLMPSIKQVKKKKICC